MRLRLPELPTPFHGSSERRSGGRSTAAPTVEREGEEN